MSDNSGFIDIDHEDYEDAPKALRDAYKKLRKQFDEVAGERDRFRDQVVSRSVGDVLSDKGFKNPKRVERDLLADGIDPLDQSAVEAWLADNGDDYARTGGTTESNTEQNEEQQQRQQAFENLNVGTGASSPAEMSKLELALSEITPDMDGAAVAALYAKHGL